MRKVEIKQIELVSVDTFQTQRVSKAVLSAHHNSTWTLNASSSSPVIVASEIGKFGGGTR